jgi:chemotaxis response regulator CheB
LIVFLQYNKFSFFYVRFFIAENAAAFAVFGTPREAIRLGAPKFVPPSYTIAATILARGASGD